MRYANCGAAIQFSVFRTLVDLPYASLLASGVPSAQIYVHALGSTPSNGPADRVELIVSPIGTVVR